jgi:ribosome-associated protein
LPHLDEAIEKLVNVIAVAADEKKGLNIIRIAVGEVSVIADYFVIITGQSRTQVRAIAGSIAESAFIENYTLRHLEGMGDASWILQDFSDVIVHVFLDQERGFYQLEAFWGHAPRDLWVSGEPGISGHWEPWASTISAPVPELSTSKANL